MPAPRTHFLSPRLSISTAEQNTLASCNSPMRRLPPQPFATQTPTPTSSCSSQSSTDLLNPRLATSYLNASTKHCCCHYTASPSLLSPRFPRSLVDSGTTRPRLHFSVLIRGWFAFPATLTRAAVRLAHNSASASLPSVNPWLVWHP